MPNVSQETIQKLRHAASVVAENAYAPYSQFRVGAALLFDDGAVVSGCNVENISYGLTICAERTALVRAIAESGPQRKIVAVMVTNLNQAASPPCGACRQLLSEFVAPDAIVCFPDDADGIITKPFAELFPYSFSDWKPDARR